MSLSLMKPPMSLRSCVAQCESCAGWDVNLEQSVYAANDFGKVVLFDNVELRLWIIFDWYRN